MPYGFKICRPNGTEQLGDFSTCVRHLETRSYAANADLVEHLPWFDTSRGFFQFRLDMTTTNKVTPAAAPNLVWDNVTKDLTVTPPIPQSYGVQPFSISFYHYG